MNHNMFRIVIVAAAVVSTAPVLAEGFESLGWQLLPHMQVDQRDILVPRDLAFEICHGGGREYCTQSKTSKVWYVCQYDLSELPPVPEEPPIGPCLDFSCGPWPGHGPGQGGFPQHRPPPRLYAVRMGSTEERYTRFAECQVRSVITSLEPLAGDVGPTGSDYDQLCQLQGRPGPLAVPQETDFSFRFVACDSLRHLPELW